MTVSRRSVARAAQALTPIVMHMHAGGPIMGAVLQRAGPAPLV